MSAPLDLAPSASDALTDDDLGTKIVGLAGRLASAMCTWLLLVADFDAREGHARYCLQSTARWLGHYCGLSRRTAIEHVRVARALMAFPALADAMRGGRLSYSHVRAISRIAGDDDSPLVDELIEIAQHGTVNQLETLVRGLRSIDDNDPDAVDATEYVRQSWSSQSRWRLSARLDPEHGAVVESALKVVAKENSVSQADALRLIAEEALAARNDDGRNVRSLRGDERSAVLIHLDAAALAATATRPDSRSPERTSKGDGARRPYARIANGPGLPDRVVRRLLCAGRIRTAIHDSHGNVRDLGRSHRVVSDRQFRALLQRDRGCALPGCGSTDRLDAHHVKHWIDGGRTDLDNLVLLCEGHHVGHHAGEFRIVADGGQMFRFFRADGAALATHIDPSTHALAARSVDDIGADVPCDAAITRWTGQRLDRKWAVSVIAQRRGQRRAS